jgi:hypothetical protein
MYKNVLGVSASFREKHTNDLDGEMGNYRGADKSLARPERKQAIATEDFEFHISCL